MDLSGFTAVLPVASNRSNNTMRGAQAQQITAEGSAPALTMLSGNIITAPMRVLPPFAQGL